MTETIRNTFDQLVLQIRNYKKILKENYAMTLEAPDSFKDSPEAIRSKYQAVCFILDMASRLTENNVKLPQHEMDAFLQTCRK